MEHHDSKPYNPDIANVFYRAGFIENWWQGIQKICDECRKIGSELPEYELKGTGLRVRFKALESAILDQAKEPKYQSTKGNGALEDETVLRVIEIIKENPNISQDELGKLLNISRRVVQKYIKILKDAGNIERVGGKRYGHWYINE